MRVMGIDPGSNCTGYGIVEEVEGRLEVVRWGSIRCNPRQAFPSRLKTIYEGLLGAIREYSPDTVAIEDLFFAVNAKSALKLGQTRGVAVLAAVNENRQVAEYTPLEVKQAVVGYGRAEKAQVKMMVARLLKLEPSAEPFDAYDALAIAICHIHTAKTKARMPA
jgi:crossover junction endodeoxyribonuclease RuvC